MQRDPKRQEFSAHKNPVSYLHPSWCNFIRQCEEMGHGEIIRLKIQDGLPMAAEIVRRKVRFNSGGETPVS